MTAQSREENNRCTIIFIFSNSKKIIKSQQQYSLRPQQKNYLKTKKKMTDMNGLQYHSVDISGREMQNIRCTFAQSDSDSSRKHIKREQIV